MTKKSQPEIKLGATVRLRLHSGEIIEGRVVYLWEERSVPMVRVLIGVEKTQIGELLPKIAGHSRMLGTALLGLAIACTVGCGPSAQEKREALDNLTSKVGQQSTQLEIENVRLTLKIVERIQGPEAAQEMDVCLSKGYEIDFATVDGVNEWVSRLADGSSLSNRRKAECDAIVKAVNHHWERQAAEEKHKDDAYDKAHAVKKK